MKRRYLCMACRCDDLEIVAGSGADREATFVCLKCQHVFYFMPDAAPRARELSLFELYRERRQRDPRT